MNDNYKRILDQYMHSSQNHNYEDVFINLFNMSKELHYLKNAFDYTGINSLGDFIYQYSYNTVIEMCKIKNIQFEDKDLLLLDVFVVELLSCTNIIFLVNLIYLLNKLVKHFIKCFLTFLKFHGKNQLLFIFF